MTWEARGVFNDPVTCGSNQADQRVGHGGNARSEDEALLRFPQRFPGLGTDHHCPTNLGVVVAENVWATFSNAGMDTPTDQYRGKTILVRGVVILKKDRPYIEVEDLGQIELVK